MSRDFRDTHQAWLDGFQLSNQISSLGAYVLAVSTLPFILNICITWRRGAVVSVDDPWGYSGSLEWATSCPPPRHNFDRVPWICSEGPAIDLHHPEAAPPSMRKPVHQRVCVGD